MRSYDANHDLGEHGLLSPRPLLVIDKQGRIDWGTQTIRNCFKPGKAEIVRPEAKVSGGQVRWDAVVQNNGFWSSPARPLREAAVADANRRLQVWLFGSLAHGFVERPVTVEIRGPLSVGDVIAELGRRCGHVFLDRVMAPGGGIFRHCRVFVNGHSVDDATTLIQTEASQTQIELILLTAAEGG